MSRWFAVLPLLSVMCLVGCGGGNAGGGTAGGATPPVIPKTIDSSTIAASPESSNWLVQSIIDSDDKHLAAVQRLLKQQRRSTFEIDVKESKIQPNTITATVHFVASVDFSVKDGEFVASAATHPIRFEEQIFALDRDGNSLAPDKVSSAMQADIETYKKWNDEPGGGGLFTVHYGVDPAILVDLGEEAAADLKEKSPLLPYLLEWPPKVAVESFEISDNGIAVRSAPLEVTIKKSTDGKWKLEKPKFN